TPAWSDLSTIVSHRAPAGGWDPLGMKTRSASTPQAGAKSLWIWAWSAGTALPASASLSTVLALMTAILMVGMGLLLYGDVTENTGWISHRAPRDELQRP